MSCNHMNFCLQKHPTYQFTYFVYYLFQDKFKNPKIMKIQQVHQKIHTRQVQKSKKYENPTSTSKDTYKTIYIILFKLFSICNSFEFKVTQINR